MKVFLSCVTREFGSYRQRLAAQLAALPGQAFEVKVQEDFQPGRFTLLDQIGAYIRNAIWFCTWWAIPPARYPRR
jgi:hypothetical protein